METIMKTILLTLAMLAWATVASAGTLEVHDRANFIPTSDLSRMQGDTGSWPFDVHILTENAASLDALEDDAHRAVTSPGVVALAVDPQHHKTVVRFGSDTGVKSGDYDSIAQAGNAHFRSHEVADGFEAMITRARASREAARAISTSSTPVVVEQGLSTGAWLWIAALFVGLAAVAIYAVRRSRRDRQSFERALDENRLETTELRSRNVESMLYDDTASRSTPRSRVPAPRAYAPVPVAPVVSPVVVQQSGGGGSDLLTGMLIGEELGGGRRDRVIEREVVRESPRPSEDSGGSSSSWDSGSSSSYDSGSSSSDSGGSSSSYDSGGSSDWGGGGGGGFDGGGGGSDGGSSSW